MRWSGRAPADVMVKLPTLVRVIASLGLASCGHEPSPSAVPTVAGPEASGSRSAAPTPSSRLGAPCDGPTTCGEGLVCRRLCGDTIGEYVPDACEPAKVAFCDVEPSRRALAPEEMMPVLSAGGLHGVLGPLADPNALTDAEVRALAVTGDAIVAGRPAPAELVPAAWRALEGRRFGLMGEQGEVCEATVTGFSLVGLEPRDGSPTEDRERVRVGAVVDDELLYYSRQNGAVYVTATLAADAECEGVVWARASDRPPVPAGPGRPVEGGERASALAAYRALAPFRAHADRFAVEVAGAGPGAWTDHRDGGGFGPEVTGFEVGGHRHVVVSAGVGDVCVGYAAALMVSFHADGELGVGALSWRAALRPRLALDLDGDGELELIAYDGTHVSVWSATVETGGFGTASATTGC